MQQHIIMFSVWIMGKRQAANLHKGTHGSAQQMRQMTKTLSNFCTWENMKEDIESIWNACTPCPEHQSALHEGRPRLDKQVLRNLEPISIIHIDLFQFA